MHIYDTFALVLNMFPLVLTPPGGEKYTLWFNELAKYT